jgi:hypothetical protein
MKNGQLCLNVDWFGRCREIRFNDTLLYGQLKFSCIHGGKDHKSSSLGKHVKSFQSIKCL